MRDGPSGQKEDREDQGLDIQEDKREDIDDKEHIRRTEQRTVEDKEEQRTAVEKEETAEEKEETEDSGG